MIIEVKYPDQFLKSLGGNRMLHLFHSIRVVVLLLCMTVSLYPQSILPIPKFVPPDLATAGEDAYYKDIAIIETNCTSNEQMKSLCSDLTNAGALVSIISSPQRMLAWVPRTSFDAVNGAHIQSVNGDKGVLSISYTAQEFRAQHKSDQIFGAVENEADQAIVEFLEFIRRPKTEDEIDQMNARLRELENPEINKPLTNCVQMQVADFTQTPNGKKDSQIQSGSDPKIKFASRIDGWVVNSSFFVESQTGTGLYNWDLTVFNRYKDFYIAGMLWWTSFASKYGRTAVSFWNLYGFANSNCQVSGEPIVIKEDSFVPTIVSRLASFTPLSSSRIGRASRYCQPYNAYVRSTFDVEQSVCTFIAYRPSPPVPGSGDTTGIWPHAASVIYGSGDVEGVYCALDTQYPQARLDPFASPYRNVIAHELGHLWGAPDEYVGDAGCFSWMYRGANNYNCQQPQPALGRPGLTMRGGEGIMVSNYTGGSSIATPVHVGVLSAASMSPIRCFASQPPGDSLVIYWCGYDSRTVFTPLCFPMEYDFCFDVWAPSTRMISGTRYYFDYWEVKWRDGTIRTYNTYANRLPSSSYTSTKLNPVTDMKAVYTNSPPDVFTANNTLSASLAPDDNSASPGRGIALKWINLWDMSRTESKIEYEQSPGTWVEVIPTLAPFRVPVSDWTGIFINAVPRVGGGVESLQPNRTYSFRLVGYFNSLRGAASLSRSVTTRPDTPSDTIYCHDNYEPNTSTSQRMITPPDSSETVEIHAACPMFPRSGEFTWFTPKNDYYRIVVMPGSNDVQLALVKRSGSYFKPKFRAQPVLTYSHINSYTRNDTMFLRIPAGTFIIKVEPEMPTYPGYSGNYLVDPDRGYFGFGEYKLIMTRVTTFRLADYPLICPDCFRFIIPRPDPSGLYIIRDPKNLIREAAIRFDVFRKGIPHTSDSFFDVFFTPEAGLEFSFFDGDFGKFTKNPMSLQIGQNTPSGNYELFTFNQRIPEDQVELVLIYPDGPDGVFEKRITKPIGTVESAIATVPSDYNFIGWGGDSVATTNPLPVTLWHNKKLIAYWKKKPCNPEPMNEWIHKLNFVNNVQNNVVLEFGMQPGAGDGLEAGQPDLPPIPPSTVFDIRWVNILGSQGSTIDHRAIQQSFTFIGMVQTGTGTVPVNMNWSPPTTLPATASMIMKIAGDPTPINMRTTTSHTFSAEGTYQIMIEVKVGCPEPTKESDITITTTRVDTKNFPCVDVELLIRDRQTGDPLPFYNPYLLKVYEKDPNGQEGPAHISRIMQRDSTIVFRICSERNDTDPNRILVVRDENNHNPDTKKDTVKIDVPIPVPTGCNTLARILQQRTDNWELVSLPLDLLNTEVNTIFADPGTTLYSFEPTTGTYDAQSSMTFGKGFWLRTSDKSTLFYGCEKNSFIFSGLNGVGEPNGYGWNLIGSISKQLPVGSITQNPPGGMLSIFGWNPSSGYLVPAVINPGEGYWVRVNPSTTLKMQVSKVSGDKPIKTAFQKISDQMDVGGILRFTTVSGETQSILLSETKLSSAEKDILRLPIVPPAPLLDVRTKSGTKYTFDKEDIIEIQAAGKVHITFEAIPGHEASCVLQNDKEEVLGEFDSHHQSSLTITVDGKSSLMLKVSVKNTLPETFTLGQNFPNPFSVASNMITSIPYTLAGAGTAVLSIYDVLGRKVRILLSGEFQAGKQSVEWDGRNDFGNTIPTGVYIYRLESNGQILSKTLSVVK